MLKESTLLPSRRTVPVELVRRLLRTAERRGADVDEILREAGIWSELVSNDLSRITADQVARITRALWRFTGDELFGAGPRPVPRGTFRLLSMALIHSPDLMAVLERFCQYRSALPGLPEVHASIGKERTRLELDSSALDDPEHVVTELGLAIAHRFGGWLIGRRIALRSVELPYPRPADAEDYQLIFGCSPTFSGADAALTFDTSLLSAPVLRSEVELIGYIDHAPADVLARRDYGSSVGDQVRRLLEHGLSGEWPSSEQVAARLHYSLQHLRRKLREEGTSMGEIREGIIRDVAIASLVRGEESVNELSKRLGFSEPSAFRRAFRRWTGSSPGSYQPPFA